MHDYDTFRKSAVEQKLYTVKKHLKLPGAAVVLLHIIVNFSTAERSQNQNVLKSAGGNKCLLYEADARRKKKNNRL